MCDLRIVLLGKNGSENSRVRNSILEIDLHEYEIAKDSQQPCLKISGMVENRPLKTYTVINTFHLLNPNISRHQITHTVRDCVDQSVPGPHAFILVLQHEDFTEEDVRRVKYVLKQFSEEAITRTIVLTTDKEIRSYFITVKKNTAVHQLIEECGGGHLQLDEEWQSEIFKRVDMIQEKSKGKYLRCEIYEDVKGTSVGAEQTRAEEGNEKSSHHKHHKKTEERQKNKNEGFISGSFDSDSLRAGEVFEILAPCNTQGFSCTKMPNNPQQRIPIYFQDIPIVNRSSRRIVLLGKTGVGKSAAGNTILGEREFISVMRMNAVTSKCSDAHATVSGRSVSVVDTPGLFDTQMNSEELVTEIARSVYLSSPGPHAFIIVFPVNMRFTEQEQQIPQLIETVFGEEVLKYSIILFTHGDLLEEKPLEELIQESSRLRDLVDQCGGRFHVFNNRDVNNRDQVNDLLQKIDTMIEENGGGHYSNQMFEDAQRFRREEEARRQRPRQEEIERVRRETEQRIRAEYEDPQEPSSGFLLFLSRYKHHIYMAAVTAGFIIGGAVGGAVVYGVVGGAVGGGVAGAVVSGGESGTATGAVKGAVGGAVGGAIVSAAAAATVGPFAEAVCVGSGGAVNARVARAFKGRVVVGEPVLASGGAVFVEATSKLKITAGGAVFGLTVSANNARKLIPTDENDSINSLN